MTSRDEAQAIQVAAELQRDAEAVLKRVGADGASINLLHDDPELAALFRGLMDRCESMLALRLSAYDSGALQGGGGEEALLRDVLSELQDAKGRFRSTPLH